MVTGPGLTLVALRAVDRNAFIIACHTPPCVMEYLVHNGVGALEGAVIGKGVVDEFGYDIVIAELLQTVDLDELEAVV